MNCMDVVKRVANIVESINEYWLLASLMEYIYLYVKATSPCDVDFDVTGVIGEPVTLVAVVKRRDGVATGRVHVEGEIAIEEDSILFKPFKANVVKTMEATMEMHIDEKEIEELEKYCRVRCSE
jgi:hypothetical protein